MGFLIQNLSVCRCSFLDIGIFPQKTLNNRQLDNPQISQRTSKHGLPFHQSTPHPYTYRLHRYVWNRYSFWLSSQSVPASVLLRRNVDTAKMSSPEIPCLLASIKYRTKKHLTSNNFVFARTIPADGSRSLRMTFGALVSLQGSLRQFAKVQCQGSHCGQ